MRFKLRELVLIGTFGALWGVVETTLGSVLHLANVPFKGIILGGIGVMILLIGRLFVPRRGATLAMGIVTAVLKMFSLGQFVINPMLAIFIEALLAEIVLSLHRAPGRRAFLLAGALAISWNFFHPFLTWGILAGQGIVTIWTSTIENGSRTLGLSPNLAWLIVAILLGIHALGGLLAGWLGWQVGEQIRRRRAMPLDDTCDSPGDPGKGVRIMRVKHAGLGFLIAVLLLAACGPAEQTAPTPPQESAAPGVILTITGGETERTFTLEQLQALPVTEIESAAGAFIGVRLGDLLTEAGFNLDGIATVRVVATDGFSSTYPPELFTREDAVLAYARQGGSLNPDEAPLRMVIPDQGGSMQPRMVNRIEVSAQG